MEDIEGMSPEQAQTAIDEIYANPEHPYHNKEDFRHRDALDKVNKLYEKIYPPTSEASLLPHQRGMSDRLSREGLKMEDIERVEEKLEEEEEEAEIDLELTPEQREGFKALKKEWGENYQGNLDLARDVCQGFIAKYGDDNLQALFEGEVGNSPAMVKALYRFAKDLKESADKEGLT